MNGPYFTRMYDAIKRKPEQKGSDKRQIDHVDIMKKSSSEITKIEGQDVAYDPAYAMS